MSDTIAIVQELHKHRVPAEARAWEIYWRNYLSSYIRYLIDSPEEYSMQEIAWMVQYDHGNAQGREILERQNRGRYQAGNDGLLTRGGSNIETRSDGRGRENSEGRGEDIMNHWSYLLDSYIDIVKRGE